MLSTINSNHNNEQHLVSVIMNCFNGEKYLQEAINSVLKQTHKNWEIIFWDNQSTDGSAKIIKTYNDLRIKYYYSKKHTVLYEARNYAFEKTKGDFLAFLDVDDIWFPSHLERQLELFIDPKVGFSCANFWCQNQRNAKKWLGHKKLMPTDYVLDHLLKDYSIPLLTLIIRRSALQRFSPPFNKDYNFIGDFDLVIRLAATFKLARVHEPMAIYRIHRDNESNKNRDIHIAELENWQEELSKDPIIGINRNFIWVSLKIIYNKGINALLLGNRYIAFSSIQKLPWCILKAKLIIALLLPTNILKKFKNL